MICPECNGRGEAIYYVETDRDENTVTVEKRKCFCRTCNGSGKKPRTNADRIRAMSDEEMANWLGITITDTVWDELGKRGVSFSRTAGLDACNQMLEWLKQPSEGE